ncbi:hypothetical protein GOP47_0009467 [Adiantum capillus-veneris]|uniref:Uncharacterized protein n=1 Tax=Adiantum capillus-veneris TaxID=13818 RepID=A0A9D4UWQ9_ADICA|nr:hypothetical protein GOP47_0009467 [Adiantum capillus-veneris]
MVHLHASFFLSLRASSAEKVSKTIQRTHTQTHLQEGGTCGPKCRGTRSLPRHLWIYMHAHAKTQTMKIERMLKVKYVKGLNGGEWLFMQKAEEELVEVCKELTSEVFDEVLTQSLHNNYFFGAPNKVTELWNEQRKLIILQEAIFQIRICDSHRQRQLGEGLLWAFSLW